MPVVRLQKKSYQLEDRIMEGYAMTYPAYLAPFADFVEIRKLQEEIEGLSSENFPAPYDSHLEPDARRGLRVVAV